jgi:hypothetical protein
MTNVIQYIMPILNVRPAAKPAIKPSRTLRSLRAKKRGIKATQAIIPPPYLGKERKRSIPEAILKNKVFLFILKLGIINFYD